MTTLHPDILSILQPFSKVFPQKRTWLLAQFLLIGLILLKGGRTICRILRFMGLKSQRQFDKYHKLLNRSRWELLKASKITLEHILKHIPEDQTVYISADEHLERRRGSKIAALGCYRDAVLSTKRNKVKSFGLKWLIAMAIVQFSWSKKPFALPFLTILTRSNEGDSKLGLVHKTTTDWMCQMTLQIRKWMPKRRIVVITDGGLASSEYAWTCLKQGVNWITRLQFNARLYAFPKGRNGRGRPAVRGERLMSPKEIHQCDDLEWKEARVRWYGLEEKEVKYVSFGCLRHTETSAPIPVRIVCLKDPKGVLEAVTLMGVSKAGDLTDQEIIEGYVRRWEQEVTHREAREHLGVESQRQWSDKAIKRCTPVLFALYSLILLMADKLNRRERIEPEGAAWYKKNHVTFSDALMAVRKVLWRMGIFNLVQRNMGPNKNTEPINLNTLWDYLAEIV